ncbi:MAG: hemerythrin domain-containing protein [Candidatus Obscuribacterales bacterium]|nr:hemerythrin domain-containing protein [Candidatus Obscuribacterales bacterium]
MTGLKRHPALQPFSRDHLVGLFHAQRLIKLGTVVTPEVIDNTVEAFSEAWHREVTVHFSDEDRLFGGLAISHTSLERLHNEHTELIALVNQLFQNPHSAKIAVQVGQLLDEHIRWEEHHLFPEIESSLNDSQLSILGDETQMIENSRQRKL